MSNSISVVGTIATTPRFITTQAGLPICSFRLASGDRRYDREKNAWVEGETNWFSVTAFRGLAQNARDSFNKGDRVIVSGRLRVRTWERDERSGTSVELEAEALGHDLRWGVTQFSKRSSTALPAEHGETAATAATGPQREWASASASTDVDETALERGEEALMRTSGGEESEDGFVPAAA